jgi:hypothetical protein
LLTVSSVCESSKCIYFTKSNPAKAVDVKTVDADLLCGEMVGMPLESLQSIISNVYRPMLAAQDAWGKCAEDQVGCDFPQSLTLGCPALFLYMLPVAAQE